MNREEKHLRVLIQEQLDYCDIDTTPKLCELQTYPENREKIEDQIVRYVHEQDMTIAEAIMQMERDYNPNMMED